MKKNSIEAGHDLARRRLRVGRAGAICLLLIIPVKLLRFTGHGVPDPLMHVAPSLLGSAGLLLMLLAGGGGATRPAIGRTALLAGAIALGLECAQLIPRPGVLAHIHYRFDPLDLVATVAGTSVAALVGRTLFGRATGPVKTDNGRSRASDSTASPG